MQDLHRFTSEALVELLFREAERRMTAGSDRERRKAADTLLAVVDVLESRGLSPSGNPARSDRRPLSLGEPPPAARSDGRRHALRLVSS